MTSTLRIQSVWPALVCAALVLSPSRPASAQTPPPRPSVFQTTLEEANQKTTEISTEELQTILAANEKLPITSPERVPVFDVRTAKEYAIAHIPGTINIYEKEVQQIIAQYPDRAARMILYCNGPSCGKSKRTSEELVAAGYTNVQRYQLGMPVWRALSQTVQTEMPGVLYIYEGDRTAVWVDARTPAEFQAGSVPGAVNIQKGEATAANDDGRLPFQDKGTRVVVFGTTVQQAAIVAAEVAKKAYWNSSYFGGTFDDLLLAGLINHRPLVASRNVTLAAGAACTATVQAANVDNGSYDPDSGDSLALSVTPAGPFGLGQHLVELTGTDSLGASASSSAFVTVADQASPSIGPVVVQTQSQRVFNRRVVLVTLDYTAADNCGAVASALKVARRDSGDGGWQILDAHHVLLWTGGHGRDDDDDDVLRRYSITVVAIDDAGNQAVQPIALRGRGHDR